MAWSTRELALLAGTTVNTVRHYHGRGLLDQPDRSSNGYKHYGVRHLVRLLQIRRLRDVGVAIADLEQDEYGVGTSSRVLAELDAELVATIDRSQRARAEIAAMLSHDATGAVPPGFEQVAVRLSARERALTLIYSRLYDQAAMDDLREMLDHDADSASAEFEELPADAGTATRERLARQLAGPIASALIDYPWLSAPRAHLLKDEKTTAATWRESVMSLYNAAQLDVLQRASALAAEQVRSTPTHGPRDQISA